MILLWIALYLLVGYLYLNCEVQCRKLNRKGGWLVLPVWLLVFVIMWLGILALFFVKLEMYVERKLESWK